ncbi:MAG: hypothetical protein KGR26_10290, partial [Cyanobacteria bacterium REEB65]|nr:hypothetical protein [Cyanobacteria bacterium REEB65]
TYCDFDVQLSHHGKFHYAMRPAEGGYPARSPLFSADQAFRPDRVLENFEAGLQQYEKLHALVKGLLPADYSGGGSAE